jgi:hypothetical protein
MSNRRALSFKNFINEAYVDEFGELQDFDFSIPIYLENPSGYYYVQEIKDFTSSSESTSVELLRIG